MGSVRISLDEIGDQAFIKVIKSVNLVRIYVCDRSERREHGMYRGSEFCGGEVSVNSETIEKEYVFCDGKRVKKLYLKGGKSYDAIKISDRAEKIYGAMLVPDNCEVFVGNRIIGANNYIVIGINDMGDIDRSKVFIVSKQTFRKVFRVPMQKIIFKYIGKPKNTSIGKGSEHKELSDINKNVDARKIKLSGAVKYRDKQDHGNAMGNDIRIGTVENESRKIKNRENRDRVIEHNHEYKTNENNNYKYRATARVVDFNGNLYAFEIVDIKNGNRNIVNMNKMRELCDSKAVENIMCVSSKGKKFLKGNGIKMSDLPEIEQ